MAFLTLRNLECCDLSFLLVYTYYKIGMEGIANDNKMTN